MSVVKTTVKIETTAGGTIVLGRHGAIGSNRDNPLVTDVAGGVYQNVGTIATVSALTIYDADASPGGDLPATFLKLYFWCDQDTHVQLLSGATNVIFSCAKEDPLLMSSGTTSFDLLASADAANLTSEETLGALDEITIWNLGLVTANYHLILVL